MFCDYFNIYGMFHIIFAILINSMLLFITDKFGLDLLVLTVGFFAVTQVGLVCYAGQNITNTVIDFLIVRRTVDNVC